MNDQDTTHLKKLDASRSTLVVRTRAKGLLSAVAHDLEIAADGLTGSAHGTGGELQIPVQGLQVAGVLKRGRVDTTVLSPGDRAEITRKMREEVFRNQREIRVEVEGASARPRVRVSLGARTAQARVEVATRADGATTIVTAKGELMMTELGITPPKGPFNAFSVVDAVEIDATLVFGAD